MSSNRKHVLITGAGAGIGAALVRELLTRNYIVYAGVRDLKRAESDFQDLQGRENFQVIELDVNDPRHAHDTIAKIEAAGGLDVLVNNAGYGYYGVFEELTEDGFRAQMETNFFAALRLMRLALPAMRQRGSGLIVNVTSILGRVVLPTGSAYTSSKWALEAASEVVRYEAAPFGVRVCAVEPGRIRTNFKKNMEIDDVQGETESPYGFLNRKINRVDKDLIYTTAEACAKRMAAIIGKRRPAARYLIGLDAQLAAFANWLLPPGVMDFAIRAYLTRARRKFDATRG